jgi:hypothetical protein
VVGGVGGVTGTGGTGATAVFGVVQDAVEPDSKPTPLPHTVTGTVIVPAGSAGGVQLALASMPLPHTVTGTAIVLVGAPAGLVPPPDEPAASQPDDAEPRAPTELPHTVTGAVAAAPTPLPRADALPADEGRQVADPLPTALPQAVTGTRAASGTPFPLLDAVLLDAPPLAAPPVEELSVEPGEQDALAEPRSPTALPHASTGAATAAPMPLPDVLAELESPPVAGDDAALRPSNEMALPDTFTGAAAAACTPSPRALVLFEPGLLPLGVLLLPRTAIELPVILTGAAAAAPTPALSALAEVDFDFAGADGFVVVGTMECPRIETALPLTLIGSFTGIWIPLPVAPLWAGGAVAADAMPAPITQNPPISNAPCRPRLSRWFMVLS